MSMWSWGKRFCILEGKFENCFPSLLPHCFVELNFDNIFISWYIMEKKNHLCHSTYEHNGRFCDLLKWNISTIFLIAENPLFTGKSNQITSIKSICFWFCHILLSCYSIRPFNMEIDRLIGGYLRDIQYLQFKSSKILAHMTHYFGVIWCSLISSGFFYVILAPSKRNNPSITLQQTH